MKCEVCGHDEFVGQQPIRGTIPVLLDEQGNFLRPAPAMDAIETDDGKLYFAANGLEYYKPEGPFECLRCGMETWTLGVDNG